MPEGTAHAVGRAARMPERAALVPVPPRIPGGRTGVGLLMVGALALAALVVDGAPAGAGGALRTLGRILGGALAPDLSPLVDDAA